MLTLQGGSLLTFGVRKLGVKRTDPPWMLGIWVFGMWEAQGGSSLTDEGGSLLTLQGGSSLTGVEPAPRREGGSSLTLQGGSFLTRKSAAQGVFCSRFDVRRDLYGLAS